LPSSMSLYVTSDHIPSCLQFTLGGFQHGIGLPHTGTHSQKHLEPPTLPGGLLALDRVQQCIGIGPVFGHRFTLAKRLADSASNHGQGLGMNHVHWGSSPVLETGISSTFSGNKTARSSDDPSAARNAAASSCRCTSAGTITMTTEFMVCLNAG